jgi:hypothetical protein
MLHLLLSRTPQHRAVHCCSLCHQASSCAKSLQQQQQQQSLLLQQHAMLEAVQLQYY